MEPLENKKDLSLTKNIKMIQWLKTELLKEVSCLFKELLKGTGQKVINILSNIIIISYILGKRLGMDYKKIDLNIKKRIMFNIENEHETEKWYKDLSELSEYIKASRESKEVVEGIESEYEN